MKFLKNYSDNIIKYDLINKFSYKRTIDIPKFEKIILSFSFKKYEFKSLIAALIALELLTFQNPTITKSKVSNISLKVRKGHPIGCKLTLRKNFLFNFFFKLLNEFLLTNGKKVNVKKQKNKSFSFTVKNILIFNELERNYRFFKNLSNLNITFVTNSKNKNNLLFLLKSYKIF